MKEQLKKLSNGKSSKECTLDEQINTYRKFVSKSETLEERIKRIHAFRCGW